MAGKEEELCTAAEKGQLGKVKSALSRHFGLSMPADIECVNYEGYTPLHLAIMYGQPRVARFLIEKGADANHANPQGSTPLMACAKFGDAATAGWPPHRHRRPGSRGHFAVHGLCLGRRPLRRLELLLKKRCGHLAV